jgi:hypothetical protein
MGYRVDAASRREADEGDIHNLSEPVLSLPQRRVRPTLSSRKSTYFGPGPTSATVVRRLSCCESYS